jgi:hypothetical protein
MEFLLSDSLPLRFRKVNPSYPKVVKPLVNPIWTLKKATGHRTFPGFFIFPAIGKIILGRYCNLQRLDGMMPLRETFEEQAIQGRMSSAMWFR